MKPFKVYLNGKTGAKHQIKWLGALLIVIAIVIATIGVINYFQFPEEPLNGFSPRALIIKQLYIAAGVGILGIILLLAGAFAASSKHNSLDR